VEITVPARFPRTRSQSVEIAVGHYQLDAMSATQFLLVRINWQAWFSPA